MDLADGIEGVALALIRGKERVSAREVIGDGWSGPLGRFGGYVDGNKIIAGGKVMAEIVLQGEDGNMERVGAYVQGLDPGVLEKIKKENVGLRLENGRLRKKIAQLEERLIKEGADV